MSTVNSGAQYQLTMAGSVTGGAKVSINLQVPASDSFGDEEAGALAKGLLAVFPAAWNVNAATQLTKNVQTSTTSAANVAHLIANGTVSFE